MGSTYCSDTAIFKGYEIQKDVLCKTDDLIAGAFDLTVEQKNGFMDKVLKYNTVHINIGVSFDTYQTYLNQIKEMGHIMLGHGDSFRNESDAYGQETSPPEKCPQAVTK